MPFSKIFQLYIVASVLMVEETRVPGEYHRPVTSHWHFILIFNMDEISWLSIKATKKKHMILE